jgi:thioredoxin-like negative regulator of GroEL
MFKRRVKPHRVASLDELNALADEGKPLFIDFMQKSCGPCQTMDGIVNELAHEYRETANVAKVDVQAVAGAAQMFNVRSTPTFVVLAPPVTKKQEKQAGRSAERWRAMGLVKKSQLAKALESSGAQLAD